MSVHPNLNIHPSAVIAEGAQIPASCTIGPFCTVSANVVLGEGCELVSHVVLDGHTTLGADCKVYSFACVGISPQDLKYAGEPTRVEVGERTVIREYVTISRGTAGGGGVTRVGADCLVMAYVHIGHDSTVGNGCILPNGATLAGHVVVEDYATLSANAPVHQHCRIGRHAYIGGGTTVTQDVLPYSLTSIERNNHAYGVNKVGLQRRGHALAEQRQAQYNAGTGGDQRHARAGCRGRARALPGRVCGKERARRDQVKYSVCLLSSSLGRTGSTLCK